MIVRCVRAGTTVGDGCRTRNTPATPASSSAPPTISTTSHVPEQHEPFPAFDAATGRAAADRFSPQFAQNRARVSFAC